MYVFLEKRGWTMAAMQCAGDKTWEGTWRTSRIRLHKYTHYSYEAVGTYTELHAAVRCLKVLACCDEMHQGTCSRYMGVHVI